MVADSVPQTVADRYRSYGNTRHSGCDARRPYNNLGDPESRTWFYFPDHYDHADKERLQWERMPGTFWDGVRQSIIVLLKPCVSNCPMRMKKNVWRYLRNSGSHMICNDRRRPSPPATDHVETLLCGICKSSIADGRRPLQIIWKPGFRSVQL